MPEEVKEVPKTAVQKIFERFANDFASKLVDEFGEIKSVVLVVDWTVGQNDFPAGMLFTRDKKLTLSDMLAVNGQLNKMMERIAVMCQQNMRLIDQEVAVATNRRDALLKEVEDLERRKTIASTERSPNCTGDKLG